MDIFDREIYDGACRVLRQFIGPDAAFNEDQYEAIEGALRNRRSLIVQRTGWGKSLVYFTSTKLLRERGEGMTVVVSPLLVLMRNQIEAAERIGLRCEALNSTTRDRRTEVLEDICSGAVDLVFITPETLFTEEVQAALPRMRIGLFVIDEAHCISDWGHDFRLEYSRLKEVLSHLPTTVPVLATTATANDRVISDLGVQLGRNLFVSRGPLTRESLWIQVLPQQTKAERYAWILDNINCFDGSGIIYCLTQKDCDQLAAFLSRNGISALAYHAGLDPEAVAEAENALKENRIKALVATVKLGMGYDKDDIAFVIHFQRPANIVSYYQQIGRAGRHIPKASVILMTGPEDDDIHRYFIDSAFPTREETESIVAAVSAEEGMSRPGLISALNIRPARIDKALMFLVNDGYIYKDGPKYFAAPKPFSYAGANYDTITAMRYREMEQMKDFLSTRQCYSRFIAQALDDYTAKDCGHCANCLGGPFVPETASPASTRTAEDYLNALMYEIQPRRQWAASTQTESGMIRFVNQPGLCLSRYGDPGAGELVKRDKYSGGNRFCDELVERSARVLLPFISENGITHVCCVPSLRSDIVPDFARRLAARCGLTYMVLLQKTAAEQQKSMENGAHQCMNALNSFSVIEGAEIPERVLLVDDMVDSRWTLTVCGYRLMERGCQAVFPFALADSGQRGS